jgi:ribosomal protein S18 acetylase RimI-like enzyme
VQGLNLNLNIKIFMNISYANESDVAAIVKLVNAAYRGDGSGGGWTNESHLLEGPRTGAADVLALLNDPDSVILKHNGNSGSVDGCVHLQKQGDLLYLGMLSVSPLLQGSGIGKALLEAAQEYAMEQQCKRIQMTVISLREDLVAWYERHGYKRTGEILPFHTGEQFGIQKRPLQLAVLSRVL